jgi:phospholipase C
MDQFAEDVVPVITTLAHEFALFDGWHASVPGPTMVNRAYAAAATSDGMAVNNKTKLAKGLPQKTMYKQLLEMGLDYRVYFEDAPSLITFKDIRRQKPLQRIHQLRKFYTDAAAGDLPEFTWIEPAYFDIGENYPASDQHPDHDVSEGEKLIKKVYESMRASPLWEKSALIVTYDEHGGFFDHVSPPSQNVPNPDGINGDEVPFAFDRLGVRIPTIVMSPWVPKGLVVKAMPEGGPQYEHSSVISTVVHKLFKARPGFLTPEYLTKRDAWAATFETIFSEDTPRQDCPRTLPEVLSHRVLYPTTLPPLDGKMPLTDLQMELVAICAGAVGDESLPLSELSAWNEEKGGRYCRDAMKSLLSLEE